MRVDKEEQSLVFLQTNGISKYDFPPKVFLVRD